MLSVRSLTKIAKREKRLLLQVQGLAVATADLENGEALAVQGLALMTPKELPPPGSLEGTIGGEKAVAEIKVRRLRWAERRRERLMESAGSRL